jgi:holliday junction DNA helicase RuvA
MIARIKGEILEKTPSRVVVASGGIGFEVLISGKTFEKLPGLGEVVEMEIYTYVREDDIRLIGFFSKEDRDIFLKLLAVSGISIKIALSTLTIYDFRELRRIITARDTDMASRVPGIGKKLAERLILELKDKFDEEEMIEAGMTGGIPEGDKIFEVKQALKILGYNSREISKALAKIRPGDVEDSKVEDILRIALKEV